MALGLAVGHVVFPSLAIDAITVSLLLMAVLPWAIPFVKSLELPGGFKIETRDVQSATEKIMHSEVTGTIDAKLAGPEAHLAGVVGKLSDIELLSRIAEFNPNLALVGIRIDIERRLVALAEANEIPTNRRPLARILRDLRAREVVPGSIASGLTELVELGNRAAHGVEVSEDAAQWVLKSAPQIISQLETLRASA